MIVSREGWIKRQKSFTDVPSIRVRDEDRVGWIFRARARQTVTFLTDRGMAYTSRVNDLPLTTGHGEPIQKSFALEDQEHVIGVICHDPRCLPTHVGAPAHSGEEAPHQAFLPGELALGHGSNGNGNGTSNGHGHAAAGLPAPPYAVAMTAGGKVLRFAIAPLAQVSTKKGRCVVRLDPAVPGDLVVGVEPSDGSERVLLATRLARVLVFAVGQANVVSGAARGVTAIRLDPRDRVIGFGLCNPDRKRDGINVRTSRGATQKVSASKYPLTGRGGKGYGILQRGTLDAVIPDDVEPVPPMNDVIEGA